MPIEIRELVIRAVVDQGLTAGRPQGAVAMADREALIHACVEETMRALRRKRER